MEKKAKKQHYGLLWIDLEMTGLDPSRDVVLEVAVVASDIQLGMVQEGKDFVIHQPEDVLKSMDPWCLEQHTKSGLLTAVQSSTTSLEFVENYLLEFIEEYCSPTRFLFAGNSIHQDRAFLKRYFPRVDAKGHYRLIDVSTVKELVHAWYPNHPEVKFVKSKHHRAMDDVYESINELRHYRKHFFI
jgi:oligoribonuclease